MTSPLHRLRRVLAAPNTPRRFLLIALGAAITSFGLHNIHQRVDITEGGVLGMILLLEHWLHISPAILSPALDLLCYALAFRVLGTGFLGWSLVSTVCLAGCFRLWESLPYLLPDLSATPLLAAMLGAGFVGIGVGIVVRQGGSLGGDDALALSISHLSGRRIALSYLITDLTVLALSLSYLPLSRIACSLVTVTISSLLVDCIQSKTE